jgi:predicted nucleic acid-binding protein
MRVLIDTNVVLDFVLKRQPFGVEATEIFIRLARKEFQGFVSPITPINTFYTTRKEISKVIAFNAVTMLLQIVEIAETDKKTFQNALKSNFKDFEDAVQHESAIAENLDAIVTRNTKDFVNATMKVYSPNEFLEVLKNL